MKRFSEGVSSSTFLEVYFNGWSHFPWGSPKLHGIFQSFLSSTDCPGLWVSAGYKASQICEPSVSHVLLSEENDIESSLHNECEVTLQE